MVRFLLSLALVLGLTFTAAMAADPAPKVVAGSEVAAAKQRLAAA